jgi:hypothetical protein
LTGPEQKVRRAIQRSAEDDDWIDVSMKLIGQGTKSWKLMVKMLKVGDKHPERYTNCSIWRDNCGTAGVRRGWFVTAIFSKSDVARYVFEAGNVLAARRGRPITNTRNV